MDKYKANIEKVSLGEFFRLYKGYTVMICGLIILSSILSIYPVKLIGKIIDIVSGNLGGGKRAVILVTLIYFSMHALSGAISSILGYYTKKVENLMGHNISCSIFNHLCKLNQSFFEDRSSGEVLTRLIDDSDITIEGFLQPITLIVKSVFSFAIGLYMMISISFKVTLLLLPIGLISSYIASKTGHRFEVFSSKIRLATDIMWRNYSEGIRGMRDIKANCRVQEFSNELWKSSKEVSDKMTEEARFSSVVSFINTAFFMGVIALIIGFGGVLVIDGAISIGGLTSIMMYNGLLIDPVVDFIDLYNKLQGIKVSIKRVNEIFKEKPEYNDEIEFKIDDLESIELKNVEVVYGERKILDNINLSIKEGEQIALVGHTGSGKSTIIKVLAGFITPKRGDVVLNDKRLVNGQLQGLREIAGIVFQEVFLFNTTIKENILIANPNCSFGGYEKALKVAKVDVIIENLKEGENTVVGENGVRLSGGERQRIGIARALVRNPKLLILDEATSALDNNTALEIIDGIKREYKLTCVMVAHKLSTIVDSSCIYVMDSGKIIEKGTSEDLMKREGIYSKLLDS